MGDCAGPKKPRSLPGSDVMKMWFHSSSENSRIRLRLSVIVVEACKLCTSSGDKWPSGSIEEQTEKDIVEGRIL
jgi:hypothetical protein